VTFSRNTASSFMPDLRGFRPALLPPPNMFMVPSTWFSPRPPSEWSSPLSAETGRKRGRTPGPFSHGDGPS
jgi:hypothetical protein